MAEDAPRDRLAEFARQVRELVKRELRFPYSIDPVLADWVAGAFEERLEDDSASLDQLLGLIPGGPGHPKRDPAVYKPIARRAHLLKREGDTWQVVTDKLAAEGTFSGDERTVRDIHRQFYEELLGEEAAEGVDQKLRPWWRAWLRSRGRY